jgi:hypothetical protein
MVELRLRVQCTRDEHLSVTTAHLDMVPVADVSFKIVFMLRCANLYGENLQGGDPTDDEGQAMLRQRPRDFGQPIGKGKTNFV